MPVCAYVAFGTNLGDLLGNAHKAHHLLNQETGVRVLRVSPYYRTEPLTLHGEAQPWYLNGVFEIETGLDIKSLHAALQRIELAMGRHPHPRWHSRIMDLDLLFYGDMIYQDPELQVPHREIIHRRFVLAPFVDLSPDWIHPEFRMPMDEILAFTTDGLKVMRESLSDEAVA